MLDDHVPQEKAFLANAYSMMGQCQGMVGKMKDKHRGPHCRCMKKKSPKLFMTKFQQTLEKTLWGLLAMLPDAVLSHSTNSASCYLLTRLHIKWWLVFFFSKGLCAAKPALLP